MKALRVVLVALIAWGCATNPATGRREIMLMSEADEIQLGRQSDAQIRQQMGRLDDANLQKYVSTVGARLARSAHRPNLPWSFAVVDEPAVNAFALPGGFIYLTRGILPFLRDEAELAGVLGHEIGHVDARHSARAYSNQTLAGGGLALLGIFVPETKPVQGLASVGLSLAFLKFGREDELEADQLGVRYSSASGWDARGIPAMLNTLARLDEAGGTRRGVPNWALTHPPAADRIVKVREAVATAPATGTTNQPEFERYLDGLVFGDSREKGIVRGNQFLHPILRFAVRFPQGWEIINTDEQVAARESESANNVMLLQLTSGSGSVEQIASAQMTKAGWRPVSGDRTTINGLDAHVGTYQATINNQQMAVRAAHIRSGDRVYVVAGVAPASSFNGARRTFDSAIETFRTLSTAEADRIQPNRVDFHTARSGDTWASLAQSHSGGAIKASTLAIMNGSDPGTPPRAGQRLRIVVAGS